MAMRLDAPRCVEMERIRRSKCRCLEKLSDTVTGWVFLQKGSLRQDLLCEVEKSIGIWKIE